MSASKEYKPSHGGYPGAVPKPPHKQAIQRALDFLSEPKKWTKHETYKDETGKSCSVEEAACACLYGALRIGAAGDPDTYEAATEEVRAVIGNFHIADYNDAPERTLEEVQDVLRRAAA